MPAAFTGTPLFSIQEAVNSATSLPQPKTSTTTMSIYSDSNAHEESKLTLLLENYKRSELEYQVELKTLQQIVENFDPVYNNYHDGSLEDITNEMVKVRKEKNSQLLQVVQTLVSKHDQLLQILHLANYDAILMELSSWTEDIHAVYSSYIKFYRLDANQSKTEIKIRRRPLVRIRYLNNFIKSLKNVLIQMKEKPYSGQLLSTFEIFIFKLTKCLEEARVKDEAEKLRCERFVYIYNAKDLVQLRSVCVSLDQQDFNTKCYKCSLHYVNTSQKAALNFLNTEIIFISSTYGNSIAVVQKDSSGKNLLFAPIRQSELRFIKSNIDSNGKSLLFYHAIMKEIVQLCFTFDESTEFDFESKLLDLFPDVNSKIIYRQSTTGLGLLLPTTTPVKKESVVIPLAEAKKENIPPTKDNIQIAPRKPFSHPLRALHGNSQNQQPDTIKKSISASSKISKEHIPQQILQQIANNNESSDEEDEESIISQTEELHIVPMEKVPSPVKNPIDSIKLVEEPVFEQEPIVEPEYIDYPEKKKTIDISKYQNSLLPTKELKKSRHQSIFGSLSNFLTKKSTKKQSLVISSPLEKQQQIRTTTNMQPTKSLNSIASIANTRPVDPSLQNILSNSNFVSKPISNARVSVWTRHNWTKSKHVKLILHINNANKEYYLGAYEFLSKSNSSSSIASTRSSFEQSKTPVLMLKLTKDTDCMFNTIDIHVKTRNYKDEQLTVLIRPLDSTGMKLIGNALVCPEAIDLIINSNSCDSELSKNSQYSEQAEQNHSDSSIGSENEEEEEHEESKVIAAVAEPVQVEEKVETIPEYTSRSWSGMGNIKAIEINGKLRDLNRCVFNVLKKVIEEVEIDLIGFDFGTIELKVSPQNIKELSDLELMIKGESSYVLTFDNEEDVERFYECVY